VTRENKGIPDVLQHWKRYLRNGKEFKLMEQHGATWMHPITKTNYHLFVIIDEGSRFRMARVAAEGPGNTTNWERIKTILEESWFPIFG
jgi:hypothetical protein